MNEKYKYTFDRDVVNDINSIIDKRIEELQLRSSKETIEDTEIFVTILQSIFDKFSNIDTEKMDYKEVVGIYKGINLCVRSIDEYLSEGGEKYVK